MLIYIADINQLLITLTLSSNGTYSRLPADNFRAQSRQLGLVNLDLLDLFRQRVYALVWLRELVHSVIPFVRSLEIRCYLFSSVFLWSCCSVSNLLVLSGGLKTSADVAEKRSSEAYSQTALPCQTHSKSLAHVNKSAVFFWLRASATDRSVQAS